jgi:hypothetical protein
MKNPALELVQRKLDTLELAPLPLLGCPRRNRWSAKPWRSDVGTAVLGLLGLRARLPWGEGEADVFIEHSGLPLLWRAGPWRDWWIDDATLLVGMVRATTALRPSGAIVVHEVDGRTQARYIQCPVPESQRSFRERNDAWQAGGDEAPPRLNRRSPRARVVCPRCPVRQRCEAVDRERGETADWE